MTPTVQFIDAFRKAFSAGQLLKCTLAKPGEAAPEGLKNVYLRPVSLKKGLQIAFNFRYQTRDEVKNFDLEGAVLELEKLLGSAFLNADLLTPERDFSLPRCGRATGRSVIREPASPARPFPSRAPREMCRW